MKQQPIQSLWMGAALSPMEILCIRSYLACGHEFHLYIYDCIANIPEGTLPEIKTNTWMNICLSIRMIYNKASKK